MSGHYITRAVNFKKYSDGTPPSCQSGLASPWHPVRALGTRPPSIPLLVGPPSAWSFRPWVDGSFMYCLPQSIKKEKIERKSYREIKTKIRKSWCIILTLLQNHKYFPYFLRFCICCINKQCLYMPSPQGITSIWHHYTRVFVSYHHE